MEGLTMWYRLGAIGMALGTLVLAYGFRLVPRENYRRYSVLVAVPLIAVGAYVLMSMKLGVLETQTDATVFGLRYVDWLLTTPLHVLYLGLLAGATNRSIWQSLVLMAATILFGFAGAMVASPLKWAGFAAGGLAFVGVVYITATSFERAARETGTLALLRKLRAFVVVLWLIYPAIWVLAPVGLGLMQIETSALVVAYLDVVSKVGFGLIALSGQLSVEEATTTTEVTAD